MGIYETIALMFASTICSISIMFAIAIMIAIVKFRKDENILYYTNRFLGTLFFRNKRK